MSERDDGGPEAIAQALRDDLNQPVSGRPPALADLFAETVELRHVPATPNDGPVAGSVLRTMAIAEHEAVQRALPDLAPEAVTVTVDGDTIDARSTMVGTLEGAPVRLEQVIRLTTRDGEVVGLEAHLDEDRLATLAAVLAAGDFEVPSD